MISRQQFDRRIRSLKDQLIKYKLDAILVTNEANVTYLSGFLGSDSLLLVTTGKAYLITDSRYAEEAREDIKGFDILIVKGSTYATLKSLIAKKRIAKTGFESMNLTYEVAYRLKSYIAPRKLIPTKGLIESLRCVKDDEELKLIRQSIALTKRVLNDTVKLVRPGVSEDFVARRINMEFIKNGAKAGFDPIVASGANSSKPHARSSAKKIANNSFVKIDIGCSLNSYNSDITRMVILGKPRARFKKIYRTVRDAQALAISAIKPGKKISEIDKAGRDHIKKAGFGNRFTHALGHGVGLEVHEEPSVSPRSEGLVKAGMVFTVEPAIYIPGYGGVRIEDMVLVTNKACEVLTR